MSVADVVADLYQRDPIAAGLGIELVAADNDRVHLRLQITDEHVGWNDVCHGGVLFTLADIAMAYVSNRSGQAAIATHASIDFVDGVRVGDIVDAYGSETNLRGKAGICDGRLLVQDRTVAVFRGKTLRVGAPTASTT